MLPASDRSAERERLHQPAREQPSDHGMPEQEANPDLLRSLGRLVRGLSVIFWGLPVALIVCFHTARSQSLQGFGVIPPMVCTGWLLYGLWLLGAFQPQERIWLKALDRARLFALINFGLSPFLFWWNRLPAHPYLLAMAVIAALSALLFLISLNLVLRRLGAMLPDEGLRIEIRQFTALNLNLLAVLALLSLFTFVFQLIRGEDLPLWFYIARRLLDRSSVLLLVPFLLLPLAMTMALVWKTKEVILDSVFSGKP